MRENAAMWEEPLLIDPEIVALSEVRERAVHPASNGRLGVTAKVVVVLPIDCLKKQIQLDVAFALLIHAYHLGIHTRTSDRSFSTSIGLAM